MYQLISTYFQLNSIDFNCFQFTVNGFSTVFNLVWIYVQLIYHRNRIGTTKKSHKNPIRILDNSHRIPSDRTPTTNILLKIRVAHGLPPWKIVWVLIFSWVLKRHPIFFCMFKNMLQVFVQWLLNWLIYQLIILSIDWLTN